MMMKWISLLVLLVFVSGCASNAHPPMTVNDAWTSQHMDQRRWRDSDELDKDYLKLASENAAPLQKATLKVIGTSEEDGIKSLAAKIYLIENAKHTIDITYYIFADDLAGNAILGALCLAVERGVDVRVMVDSLGSASLMNTKLKGLMECENQAGYILDRDGSPTNQKARVQAIVFNAISERDSKLNHRSHDKLFIVDGAYNEDAYVITGGRNMSLHYYGIDEQGQADPTAFRDIEIIVRPLKDATPKQSPTLLSEYYYTILSTKPGNKKLDSWITYSRDKQSLLDAYATLKNLDVFQEAYSVTPALVNQGYVEVETRFAHELDNLNATNVVEKYSTNKLANENSISGILARAAYTDKDLKTIKVVSPYLFLQSELFKDEGVLERDLNTTVEWLNQDPERRIEVLTNSVITSDNYFTQAVIDMQTVPTMLMYDEEMKATWLDEDLEKNELNEAFIESQAWKKMVNHPRVFFYQLGKPDSVILGGDQHYGKLHAKFIITDNSAFVGTTNLDFRSLLYNNEMGFFLSGEEAIDDLNEQFEILKQDSLRWGSPEWLRMRKELMQTDDRKGSTTKKQRRINAKLEDTGLKYLF